MRITIVSHSLVHPRQALFCQALRDLGHEVQEIYPSLWFGGLKREGGVIPQFLTLSTISTPSAQNYILPATTAVQEFSPDVVYSMTEVPWTQTPVSHQWAKENKALFVLFVWENMAIHYLGGTGADLIIAGNQEAARLHDTDVVLPQVGIDVSLFSPDSSLLRDVSVLYIGRDVPEKGLRYIKDAYPGVNIVSGLAYEELPAFYRSAKVFVSYPYETPFWKEQSMGYTNLEALACGVPVITSNCGAIPEYLEGCPGVVILPQRNVGALKEAIEGLLGDDPRREQMGREGREWVVKRFSNQVIAKRLTDTLETAWRVGSG